MALRSSSLTVAAVLLAAHTAHADGFGTVHTWNDYFAILDDVEVAATGDFDGDGRADIVDFSRGSGAVYVSRSTGASFGGAEAWHGWFAFGDELPMVGDFDGDTVDDIVLFRRDAMGLGAARGDVFVALSNGSSFGSALKWHEEFGRSTEVPMVGDVDDDGLDDLILFVQDTWGFVGRGDVYVALSTGSSFGPAMKWHDDFARGDEVPRVGDFNGDGKTDVASFVRGAAGGSAYADVVVAISDGTSFGEARVWNDYFGQGAELPLVADFDGDGCDDIGVATRTEFGAAADIFVATADCSWGFAFQRTRVWHDDFGVTRGGGFLGLTRDQTVDVGDVDGDGLVDLVGFVQGGFADAGRGDVRVALNAEPTPQEPLARAEDFGFGVMKAGGKPALGQRPLMNLLLDFSDQRFRPPHDKSFFRQLMFGIGHSVNGFFIENSVRQFAFTDAGFYGPFTHSNLYGTDVDESMYACATGRNPACLAAEGNDIRFRAEAIRLAAANGVEFATYDSNDDGRVTDDELVIFLWVAEPVANMGASVRAPGCVEVPSSSERGYVLVCSKVAGGSEGVGFANAAHELTHVLQGDRPLELYGTSCYSNAASMMSCTGGAPEDQTWSRHLDPWHKMQLGWVRPRVFPLTGPGSCAFLSSVQTAGAEPLTEKQPILIYDPRRGSREFFLLENRDRTVVTPGTYDGDATTEGAVVWQVAQNDDHTPLRVPAGLITGGDDKLLDSTVAGDDLAWDNDGDGDNDRLWWGPDGIMQSTVAGDDVRLTEPVVYTVGRGSEAQARGVVDPWAAEEGTFRLRWLGGRDAEVALDVANTSRFARVALRWSWHSLDVLRPFGRLTRDERICHGMFGIPAMSVIGPFGPMGTPGGSFSLDDRDAP